MTISLNNLSLLLIPALGILLALLTSESHSAKRSWKQHQLLQSLTRNFAVLGFIGILVLLFSSFAGPLILPVLSVLFAFLTYQRRLSEARFVRAMELTKHHAIDPSSIAPAIAVSAPRWTRRKLSRAVAQLQEGVPLPEAIRNAKTPIALHSYLALLSNQTAPAQQKTFADDDVQADNAGLEKYRESFSVFRRIWHYFLLLSTTTLLGGVFISRFIIKQILYIDSEYALEFTSREPAWQPLAWVTSLLNTPLASVLVFWWAVFMIIVYVYGLFLGDTLWRKGLGLRWWLHGRYWKAVTLLSIGQRLGQGEQLNAVLASLAANHPVPQLKENCKKGLENFQNNGSLNQALKSCDLGFSMEGTLNEPINRYTYVSAVIERRARELIRESEARWRRAANRLRWLYVLVVGALIFILAYMILGYLAALTSAVTALI